MPADRPFIVLPPPVRVPTTPPPPPRGGGPQNPRKDRQIERLGPQFSALRTALDDRNVSLGADPSGVAPEQVVVLETNGPVADFLEAIRKTEGLSWLAEEDLTDLVQDDDFRLPKTLEKKISARVYLVMTNQKALAQLLSVWEAWTKGDRKNPLFSYWRNVFARLRQVRRWGVEDRLRDTGILEDWDDRKGWPGEIPVEIELWFSQEAHRTAAVERVTRHVALVGGRIVGQSLIPEIAYHALLARLPRPSVERLLIQRDIDLVRSDDIHLFRPIPQVRISSGEPSPSEEILESPREAQPSDPIVGLLDGLPVENHKLLAGHLMVDDPDGWAAEYPVARRRHGTAMASLISNGDMNVPDGGPRRRLYVRPILRPQEPFLDQERAPEDVLFVDLVHRAVRRALEGEGGEPPAAPGVRIFNFSIGDAWQPFSGTTSPLARLLDWLSWKYKVLFIVSAGNHSAPLRLPKADAASPNEATFLRAVRAEHRLRRLLAPAEAVNVITVGAQHADAATWKKTNGEHFIPFSTDGLPAPFSGLGRGYRRAVKPDVLAPGGRAVLVRRPIPDGDDVLFDAGLGPKMPGQRVASPGINPGVGATEHWTGTSNSAALATRAAAGIHDTIIALVAQSGSETLRAIPSALWTKALLVHTADWPKGAVAILRDALDLPHPSAFKDEASAFLGYGVLRPERGLGSNDQRVTLLGGGLIAPGDTWLHRVPLPQLLHAQRFWRRLTITLAWFTPVKPSDRRYRAFAVNFAPPVKHATALMVDRSQAHGRAVGRGTVQHEVLENLSSAMDVAPDAEVKIPVTCAAEASVTNVGSVPYALAVTLEVAPETKLGIYDAVRQQVQVAVRTGGFAAGTRRR